MNQHTELTFTETTTNNKLFCQFDDKNGILLLDVVNAFLPDDFQTILSIINPYFEEHGELRGLIIHSKKFPYWNGAQNRLEYFNFARNNHHKFQRVALSMGGFFPKILAKLSQNRIRPEVRVFKYNQIASAQSWILFE